MIFRKGKTLIQLPILVAGFHFFFDVFRGWRRGALGTNGLTLSFNSLYYFTEHIGFSVFALYEVTNLYNLQSVYTICSCSIIKIAVSDLLWKISQKYKWKFTCMIHSKLFTPRASVDFALNWKKLLLLNHNKRTLNDKHASKMLHYRRQKFAKFPVLFLV